MSLQVRRPKLGSGISRLKKVRKKSKLKLPENPEGISIPSKKKDPVKYVLDGRGKLEKLAKKVIRKNKEFRHLKHANMLYCYRKPARIDKDGLVVAGQARKMPVQARDLFGVDFVIEMAWDVWKYLSKKAKYRLMWHELNHCQFVIDEAAQPVRDRHGRIKLALERHDLVIKTFRGEVKKFGVAGHEKAIGKFLRAKAKAKELNKDA